MSYFTFPSPAALNAVFVFLPCRPKAQAVHAIFSTSPSAFEREFPKTRRESCGVREPPCISLVLAFHPPRPPSEPLVVMVHLCASFRWSSRSLFPRNHSVRCISNPPEGEICLRRSLHQPWYVHCPRGVTHLYVRVLIPFVHIC